MSVCYFKDLFVSSHCGSEASEERMINPQDNLVVHDSLTKPRAGTKGRVIERKKNKRRGEMEGEIKREREIPNTKRISP